MTQTDIEYKTLIERILNEGIKKEDRTGTGTLQIFGAMGRYDCKNNRLPLLTTKRVHFKSVLHELLWFLKGDTNIQYLCQNNVKIWDEWPYNLYIGHCKTIQEPDLDILVDDPNENCLRPYSIEEFAKRIANDDQFAKTFGDIGKVYGKQWVNWECAKPIIPINNEKSGNGAATWESINQLQNAINTLNTNPDSRRILVTAWYPGQVETACLPPCHYSYQFCSTIMDRRERTEMFIDYCRMDGIDLSTDLDEQMEFYEYPKRKLSILFNMRSVDVGLGYSFDIASYGVLLAMVAKFTKHVTREVIISSADTHIYSNHIDAMHEQIKRVGHDIQPWIKIDATDIKSIFDLKYENFQLINYISDAPIKMKVAV